jgi:hypothetical protein
MNLTECTKREAQTLSRFGHNVFARLDKNMKPVAFFSSGNGVAGVTAPAKKAKGARASTLIELIKTKHKFGRDGSRVEDVHKCIVKKFDSDERTQITRGELQDHVEAELGITNMETKNAFSSLVHSYKTLAIVK